jgi:uncharacterized membrane protein
MSISLSKMGRWAGITTLVAGYPLLAHYSSTSSAAAETPSLGVALALAPTLAILFWLAWRAPRRVPILALCLTSALLLWVFWHPLEKNFNWVYFIQHAGTNILLAMVFGLTLGKGRQSLCTRFAEIAHGNISPAVVRYTRQVTLAWTLFFVTVSGISAFLFLCAPIQTWSIFANFLTLPLVVTMFIVEFLVRLRTLPNELEHRFIDGLLVYWKHSGFANGAGVDNR